jgi:hypothetical protein
MNKKIHENDLEKEKQVFEVTLPKYNIEKMQMCVGNAYDSKPNMNKYNIYNVDKNTKKVTECVGYYELEKGTEVLDKDGDFNVVAIGENAIELYPEFVSGYSSKPKKSKESKITKETQPKKLPNTVSLSPKYVVDDQKYMQDYFENKYDLPDEQIIPTFLKYVKKPQVWANEVAISLTGMFSNVYIIIANEDLEYDETQGNKPSTSSTKLIDYNMTILPRNEELDYDKDRKYVIVSYKSQTHYRLVESNGKVSFLETELPRQIIERFCSKHHPSEQMPDGVDEFPVKVIETASSGDCFFDSIYRATHSVDANASPNTYLKDVHKYREEIADGVESKPMAQQIIMQAYRVNAVQDVDTARNKFYNDKFGRKATPEDDAVFKYAYSSIFGANKHSEDDFSFADKETILMTYLTLLYDFFPDVSQENQDEFKGVYNGLYGVGKTMDIKDSLDKQRTVLAKSFGPDKPKEKEETKVDELKTTTKIVKKPKAPPPVVPVVVPVVDPVVVPVVDPVVVPVAPEPKSTIDVSSIADPTTKTIVTVYLSSESQEAKKAKLGGYSVKELESAWKVVNESNPDLFRATPVPKNKLSFVDCLSGDVSEKCVKEQKQSKKAKDKKGGKYTRKNI